MPPKRARASGSSSHRRSSDTDSSGGYTGDKFLTPEAQAEFNRLLTKAVAKERGLLPTFQDGNLLEMVVKRGWVAFCESPGAAPLSVVREFYAHAKASMNGYSWVRGFTVDYTPQAIRLILNQPPRPRGADNWVLKTRADVDLDYILETLCVPGTVWKRRPGSTEHVSFPASAMNRYARAWNSFMCANICPTSHSHEVTVDRAILLWGILNDEYIDVGYLINRSMIRFMSGGTTGAIPHASIVTKLCASVGVRWAPDEQLHMPSAPIDHAAISKLADWPGGIAEESGLGYEIRAAGAEEAEGGSPPPHERAGGSGTSIPHLGDASGLGTAQFRRLTRRVDAMHDINRRFASDLTIALDGVYQSQGVTVEWPVFGAHATYPPPDTPPEEGDDDFE